VRGRCELHCTDSIDGPAYNTGCIGVATGATGVRGLFSGFESAGNRTNVIPDSADSSAETTTLQLGVANAMDKVEVRSDVRLVLLTGNPGGGKTTLAHQLTFRLPKYWRVISLDDFLQITAHIEELEPKVRAEEHRREANVWPAVGAHTEVPGAAIRWYISEGASVGIEGIMFGDEYAAALCGYAGLSLSPPAVRVIYVGWPLEEVVDRMEARSLRSAHVKFDRVWGACHWTYVGPRARVSVATPLDTCGMTKDQVRSRNIRLVNDHVGLSGRHFAAKPPRAS
jgi:chloramphenicol 3-O-phosphotransferase